MHWESPGHAPHTCQVPILAEFSARRGSLGSLVATSKSSKMSQCAHHRCSWLRINAVTNLKCSSYPHRSVHGFVVVRLLPEKNKLVDFESCQIHFLAKVEFGDFSVGHRVDQRTVKNKSKYTQFSLFLRVFWVADLRPKTSKFRPVFDSQKFLEMFIIIFPKCLTV